MHVVVSALLILPCPIALLMEYNVLLLVANRRLAYVQAPDNSTPSL